MRSELIDLDLTKLADIANAFALESVEVGCDAGLFEVDNASEGLVEKGANGLDWKVAGFGLNVCLEGILVELARPTARVWIMALNPRSTLPVPMISVTSCQTSC